jgi:3',5'-nucleoside bisphosphate phosphatase
MNQFRADLHCHTTCSDGTYTPEHLVKLAKEKGLSGLSITDHDTIDAYDIAMPMSQQLGIEMIPGVEFSAIFQRMSVHVLGYAYSLTSQAIKKFCQRHIERRKKRNALILKLLANHKMVITEEELYSDSIKNPHTVGRPHIAKAMINKGYVQNINEAFKKFIGDGKCCFSAGESFSVQETIDVIHEGGGLAIIAHPHLIDNSNIFQQLTKLKFDGIECFYSRFPAEKQYRWVEVAKKKGWLITGGSDFHGDTKPTIALGCSWAPEETFRFLQEHYKKNVNSQQMV